MVFVLCPCLLFISFSVMGMAAVFTSTKSINFFRLHHIFLYGKTMYHLSAVRKTASYFRNGPNHLQHKKLKSTREALRHSLLDKRCDFIISLIVFKLQNQRFESDCKSSICDTPGIRCSHS